MASDRSSSGEHTKGSSDADELIDRTSLAEHLGRSPTEPLPLRLECQRQHLLPGIPDYIMLNNIATKLPWTDSHILPPLSRSWNEAIQSRQLYGARVRSHSTETLVVVRHHTIPTEFIALYSMRRRTFYFLPSIAGVHRGIPSECQCVSLDGRVYILGGLEKKTPTSAHALDSVYVLDLVGRRKWRRCANMLQPRFGFGCAVMNGKIYVFGGITVDSTVRDSLVYDPKGNVWSPIAPMLLLPGRILNVIVLEEELVLHGVILDLCSKSEGDKATVGHHLPTETSVLQAYNPITDGWTEKEKVPRLSDDISDELVFSANGYFYVMTGRAIYRYDCRKSGWTEVHTFSCAVLGLIGSLQLSPTSVVLANDELLATFCWFRDENWTRATSLLRSRGFGGENKLIVWEKVNSSLSFGFLYGTVQL